MNSKSNLANKKTSAPSLNELKSNIIDSNDSSEFCKENPEGVHMYKNNICTCGKVIDIIQEDEEEYDEEGKICLRSNTGNHHYINGECKYCHILESRRYSLSKQIMKIASTKKMTKVELEDLVSLGNEKINQMSQFRANTIHIRPRNGMEIEPIPSTGRGEIENGREANGMFKRKMSNGENSGISSRKHTLIFVDNAEFN